MKWLSRYFDTGDDFKKQKNLYFFLECFKCFPPPLVVGLHAKLYICQVNMKQIFLCIHN